MLKLILILNFLAALTACRTTSTVDNLSSSGATAADADSSDWLQHLDIDDSIKLIKTPDPDGHRPFISAIAAASKSIDLEMYHLLNPEVVKAFVDAQKRGVKLRLLLNGSDLDTPRFANTVKTLTSAGIPFRHSSSAFSLTHVKAMIVDRKQAFVTSINLTTEFDNTRDYGVILANAPIITEMQSVFEADWKNAQNSTEVTPSLSQPNLIWSPTDSRTKLVQLIRSAKQSIQLTVENLGDPAIMAALGKAAAGDVHVQVITPLCDKNKNPLYNIPFLKSLAANGVVTRVMPSPPTAAQPYMHSKMILVDNSLVYLGSVNFSANSTQKARELGIVLNRTEVVAEIAKDYAVDWSAAQPVPATLPTDCPIVP